MSKPKTKFQKASILGQFVFQLALLAWLITMIIQSCESRRELDRMDIELEAMLREVRK